MVSKAIHTARRDILGQVATIILQGCSRGSSQ
jgi:hypothetical protein